MHSKHINTVQCYSFAVSFSLRNPYSEEKVQDVTPLGLWVAHKESGGSLQEGSQHHGNSVPSRTMTAK